MKKLFLPFILVFTAVFSFSQTPEKMSYQAVIRNSSDVLVTNAQIGMRISILQGTATGSVVYTETQTPTTNANGLVSLEIGSGTTTNDFSAIDWSAGSYFIKTETDPTGGINYNITGTSQLLSVPYALFAKTSSSALPGPKGDQGESGAQGPTAQVHLTQAFIPWHPETTERLSLSFVTAATSKGRYSGGTCPPGQVYDYDILDCNGTSIINGDVALRSPDNEKSFTDDETSLKSAPESYNVVITGSPRREPVAPARVDIWVSDIVQDVERKGTFTRILYHFSWSASQEWIFERWKENGSSFTGPNYPNGIPLLINTNHTFKL